jgi:hypothetical protein
VCGIVHPTAESRLLQVGKRTDLVTNISRLSVANDVKAVKQVNECFGFLISLLIFNIITNTY